MKSILIISDYFGVWPKWFEMYLESCRCNPTVDWCIHTDCCIPDDVPSNVKIVPTNFDDYCDIVSRKLGVRFKPENAYSLCNIRPMIGVIHDHIVAGYDYFGWSDLDVIYGDIRAFYDDDVLTHNVISAHGNTCSGHLTLVKNETWLKEAYLHIHEWRSRLEDARLNSWCDTLDEAHLTALFAPAARTREEFCAMTGTFAPHERFFTNNYFVEQWSTPFTPQPWLDGSYCHPEVWFWHNGRVFNNSDQGRQFLYLHLMNFKAPRWVNEALYGQSRTWQEGDRCLYFEMNAFHLLSLEERWVRIDREGLHLVQCA